eukprot:PhM_4_TR3325/c0_g1_i1/m.87550
MTRRLTYLQICSIVFVFFVCVLVIPAAHARPMNKEKTPEQAEKDQLAMCNVCVAFVSEVDRALQVYTQKEWSDQTRVPTIYDRVVRRVQETYAMDPSTGVVARKGEEQLEKEVGQNLKNKRTGDGRFLTYLDFITSAPRMRQRVADVVKAHFITNVQVSPTYLVRRMCREAAGIDKCFEGMPESEADSAFDLHMEEL